MLTPDENEGNKMQVVSVGTNNNFLIKKYDIVLINSYSGSQFTIDKNVYVLIKECDILAVLQKENE